MKVYIIVPVRNRRDITREFIRCVRAQTYADIETVIIDDGSTDGTPEMIAKEFSDALYIRGYGNYYWSGAINVGLKHVLGLAAEGDRILILNDDLEFSPDYIETLVRFSQTNERAIIGSVVVDITNPGIINDGGRIINWWTAKRKLLHNGLPLQQFRGVLASVSTLTGRGVIFPSNVFRHIGLYDEKRFKHRGDTELPVRASKVGYELQICYDAVVKSHVEMTHGIDIANSYKISDIKKYFFDFKSSGDLLFRFNFALRTRLNPIQFVSFLLFDYLRVAFHFFSRVRFGPDHLSI